MDIASLSPLSLPRPLRIAFILSAVALLLAACGDDDPPSNERFTFIEGEPGTHAGAYVTVEVDGEEYHSNGIEIFLDASDDFDSVESSLSDIDSHQSALTSTQQPQRVSTAAGEQLSLTMPEEILAGPHGELTLDHLPDDPQWIEEQFENTLAALQDVEVQAGPTDMLLSSDRIDGCDEGPHIGATVDKMGTFDGGWHCWFSLTGSVEGGGVVKSYNWTTRFAPEGSYFELQQGEAVKYPPDIAGAGWSYNFGCMTSDQPDIITRDFIGQMQSLGIGFSYMGLSYSIGFLLDTNAGYNRGMEVGTGFGISTSTFFPTIAFFMPISITVGIGSEPPTGPIAVTGYLSNCMSDPDDTPGNPAEQLDQEMSDTLDNEPSPFFDPGDNGGGDNGGGDNGGGGLPGDECDPDDDDDEDCEDEEDDGINRVMAAEHNVGGNTATAALTGDFFGWLNSPAGVSTADNIPAGTHADWYGEWFDAGQGACDDCSNTSINALAEGTGERLVSAVNNNDEAGMLAAGIWGTQQYLRSAPEFGLYPTMTEGIEAAINANFHHLLARGAEMNGDPTQHISTQTLQYAARADETVDLPVTATEIVELITASGQVTATEEDIQGAEFCITTFRDDSEVCGTLDGEALVFNYTTSDPEPRLFTIDVDLSSAQGFSDVEDIDEWQVQPARRLITPLVDNPERAYLTSAPATISGSPVTLNAQLTDENNRLVKMPATFRFYDAKGNLLAEVESDDGRATHQFIPEPVAPNIVDVEEVTINYDSDTQGVGYVIHGERLSQYAEILVDGSPLDEEEFLIQYEHPGAIIIGRYDQTDTPFFDNGQTVEFVNPGDLSDSHTTSF